MTELSRRQLLAGTATAAAATALTPFVTAPARATAPAIGKQAPGIYRYKVGSFEVTVVTDGGNNNPLPDNFISAPRADVNAALAAISCRLIGLSAPTIRWLLIPAPSSSRSIPGSASACISRARAPSGSTIPTCRRPASTAMPSTP